MGFTNVVFVHFGTVVAMDMVQEGRVKSVFSNQSVLGGFYATPAPSGNEGSTILVFCAFWNCWSRSPKP